MAAFKLFVPCLLVVMLLVHEHVAFPNGAPSASCKTLEPGHGTNSTSGFYSIKVSNQEIYGGNTLDFRLEGFLPFKGFLVKSVIKGTNINIGKMIETPGTFGMCSDAGLTHTDGKTEKRERAMRWEAPSHVKRNVKIEFRASVVRNYDTYYYVKSNEVLLRPTTTPAPTPAPTRAPTRAPTQAPGRSQTRGPPTTRPPGRSPNEEEPLASMSAQQRNEITQVGQLTRRVIRWAWQYFLRTLFPNTNFTGS